VILSLSLYGAKSGKRLSVEGRPNTEFEGIPLHLNDWSGIQSRFSEENYKQLPTASLLLRYYEHDEYPLTELAIVYGTDLGDFHQPEFCLEGQGLRTLDKKGVTIQGEDESVNAIALIMDSSYGKRAFLYWFASEGATDTSLGNYKIKIFFDRFNSWHSDIRIVLLSLSFAKVLIYRRQNTVIVAFKGASSRGISRIKSSSGSYGSQLC